jgi:EPS-associated MarR family transcriptional regulator
MQIDEIHYKVMRLVEANPHLSQRQLASELGVSVGKANYCLGALVRAGLIKVRNFRNSSNKAAYMYLVTPRGIREKARLAVRFLGIKVREYELLRAEIEQIRREAGRGD